MNKSWLKAFLIRIPIFTKLISNYDRLKEEVIDLSQKLSQAESQKITLSQKLSQAESQEITLSQQLEQRKTENATTRYQLVDSLIRYLIQREPQESEIDQWTQSSLSESEIFIHFFTSETYQNRLHVPRNNTLFGLLTKAESINSYLLYPSFDQAQLLVTLTSEPYQLSDFNACLNFLKERNWLIPEKSTFLDIGANIGSMSIYAIASGHFTKAIGIEASALNYQFMCWNIAINQLNEQIYPLNYGLADFVGQQDLICSPYNCGDFRMSPQQNQNLDNLYHEDQFNVERVDFLTLDQLSIQYNIKAETIGWVCIDCQGSEGLVFKGGQKFLHRLHAPIYVEFWPYGINRLNCRDEYFEFVAQYANAIFRWVDSEAQQITIDFLKEFYEENIHTTLHLDILLLPAKTI